MRVLDITTGIAGAYCAKLLTDIGADVVFTTPIASPLFTYLRTSQRHGDAAAWQPGAENTWGVLVNARCCDLCAPLPL
jgi:crotonobetainyl-CoA:carnitine CoA-transferase CaiB-like acyl-CoA transferase